MCRSPSGEKILFKLLVLLERRKPSPSYANAGFVSFSVQQANHLLSGNPRRHVTCSPNVLKITNIACRQRSSNQLQTAYYCAVTPHWWCSGVAVRRWTCNRTWVQFPSGQSCITTSGKLFTPIYQSPSSITWYGSKKGDVLWLGR